MTYNTQSKLHRRPVCSTEERRCLQCDSEQSLLKPLIPCLCSGWLRLRSAHLSSLRQVLPGGPAALLHGGPRHRRCHLLEGEPDVVIMHEIVTRREFESLQHKGESVKLPCDMLLLNTNQTLHLWSQCRYDRIFVITSCLFVPPRHCPQTPSRGCQCTTKLLWRTTKWVKRLTTGVYPVKSP